MKWIHSLLEKIYRIWMTAFDMNKVTVTIIQLSLPIAAELDLRNNYKASFVSSGNTTVQ
jgi:hypothetical protein